MSLSNEQIKSLIEVVASTTDDQLDCDGCYDQIAEFADTQLAGLSLSDAMKAVESHLANCPCCKDEYETLLAALRGCDESSSS